MSSNLFYIYFFCVLVISYALGAGIFTNRSEHLLDEINKKYPPSVVIEYLFSFSSGWETKVDTEDIPNIKKYRKADLQYYVVLILALFSMLILINGNTWG